MPFKPDLFLEQFEPIRRLRKKHVWVGYAVAVFGTAAGVLVRQSVGELPAPFITFFPVVIAAALLGGWRAGLTAVGISAAAAEIFLIQPPLGSTWGWPGHFTVGVYVIVASLLVAIVGLLNEAVDRIWMQSDNVRFILESEPIGVIAVDSDGRVELVNGAAEKLFGYRREELYGQPVEVLLPDESRHHHVALRSSYLDAPQVRPMGAGRDLSGRRKDGTTMPIEVALSPLEREGARGALAMVVDISERKAAERRQQILVNEVRHRGRNLLALVQAIAKRTIPVEARREFLAAVESLARTQDLFLETGGATLSRIIDIELAPVGAQVAAHGCDIALTARAAQDFALIVHELTTNALKHGALSKAEGRISIVGWAENGEFSFLWEERGGPPVEAPQRFGFGRTILDGLANSFCERVEASYLTTGFRYQLRMRLSGITGNVIDLADRRGA